MRLSSVLSVGALCLAGVLATPAAAAPIGAGALQGVGLADSTAEKVHWRPYRHCHRRHGRRYCHGGRRHRHYKRYGVLPGVGIYIGPSRSYRRSRRYYD